MTKTLSDFEIRISGFHTQYSILYTVLIMVWANFLHIYQPPTQKKYWIDKVTHESYKPLFEGILKNPKAKVVLNINAVLSEHLVTHGHTDVIDTIRTLAEKGQLEFTGSAKYHPLLPRIPKDEVVRQVKLNEETNKRIFGDTYSPKGFFPPEMAFSVEVAGIVRELGYEWIIVDELSYPNVNGGKGVDYSKVYTVAGLDNFAIYFRERQTSNKILGFQFANASYLVNDLSGRINNHEYLLTAMDGETFGHHRLGLEQLLFDLYAAKELPSVFISELAATFTDHQAVVPLPATWALMEKDLEQNTPFARWDDKDNEIHRMQWELLYIAIDAVKQYADSQGKARVSLDRAIHSDQFWWAGAKPWWSIEYIESGAKELRDTVLACDTPEAIKAKAQTLYFSILTTAFDWQRSGKVDELSHQEDEEIRQRVDRALPTMKEQEFAQMVRSLEVQKKRASEMEEYERAAQFRDRINELQEQWKKLKTAQSV